VLALNPTFVRFGPKADKLVRRSECPLCARSGHQASKEIPQHG